MEYYSKQISKLIEELAALPGIGHKISTASGISYFKYAGGSCAGAFRMPS